MSEHHAQVEELLADYRRSKERLASVQRELASVSASASDANELVTATVGPRGTLTALKLSDEAYRRYRPAELAEEIVRVTAEATVRALTAAGEVLAPSLPSGTDPQALMLGTGDLTAEDVAPEAKPAGAARRPSSSEPDEESLEDQRWMTR